MVMLNINGKLVEVDVDLLMLLFWVLCDNFGLIGMKFGCGVVLCGVCMVYLNGQFMCSCVLLIFVVVGQQIIMFEYIVDDKVGKVVFDVWVKYDVV